MSDQAFYSDRSGQPVPRISEEVSQNAWRGVIALIRQRIADGSLAHDFPLRNCPDGDFVTGTAEQSFTDSLHAHVPDLHYDFLDSSFEAPPTPVALDVIDFVARHIQSPTRREPHHYFGHEHLFFGRGNNDPFTRWLTPGHQQLRQDVDLVFARNGIAFTVGTDMRIARLGPPEARKLISDLRPATGDARLDNLLNDATTRFLSRDLADRQIALEKLWDAFERLKTLRRAGQKRASLEELLAEAFPNTKEFRDRVNVEFRTLTDIGNEFPIRHHEHDRYELPAGASDYLFIRLVAIISYVLRQTGLMSPSSL